MSSGRAMAALGPLLHVVFRPNPEIRRQPRRRTGERVAMLIDPGAECTMVDDRTPKALGYKPDFYTTISGATGAPKSLPVYRMTMIVRMIDGDGMSHDVAFTQDIVGVDPRPHRGADFGLLGRDYLANMRLIYDGPRGLFSLVRVRPQDG